MLLVFGCLCCLFIIFLPHTKTLSSHIKLGFAFMLLGFIQGNQKKFPMTSKHPTHSKATFSLPENAQPASCAPKKKRFPISAPRGNAEKESTKKSKCQNEWRRVLVLPHPRQRPRVRCKDPQQWPTTSPAGATFAETVSFQRSFGIQLHSVVWRSLT